MDDAALRAVLFVEKKEISFANPWQKRDFPFLGQEKEKGQQVLVLKTGAAGEAPCVAGTPCGDEREVSPGEVVIYSGSSTIRLGGGTITISGGVVNLVGKVLANGKLVMTEA